METKPEYETKALTVRQPLTPTIWQMILAISQTTKDSGRFSVLRSEETAIKMLVAYEHNIPLTSALSNVYVIEGKPSIAPVLFWGKVLAHPDFGGYEEERLEKNGAFHGWKITLWRKNGAKATRQFTLDDAQRVGLSNKTNWKNYPEDVCYWRVIARVIKAVFADVTQGIYGADELGASITPDGNVIDATPSNDPWTATVKAPASVEPKVDMGFLVDNWGADRVLEINGGNIPNTQTEIEIVCAKLRAQYPKEEEVF